MQLWKIIFFTMSLLYSEAITRLIPHNHAESLNWHAKEIRNSYQGVFVKRTTSNLIPVDSNKSHSHVIKRS